MNDDHTVDRLVRARASREEALARTKQRIIGTRRLLEQFEEEQKSIEFDLAEIEAGLESVGDEVVVSDHAVLRYMERVMGLEVEQVRKEIRNQARPQFVSILKDATIPGPDGIRFVVRGKVVVTVKPGGE